MDFFTIVGVLLAAGAVLVGNGLAGDHSAAALWQPAALTAVAGGALGATLVQTSLALLRRALEMVVWTVSPPAVPPHVAVDRIVNWSHTARKDGLLSLEPLADSEPNLFARKGLQLLVDGSERETIRAILETESRSWTERDLQAAGVFKAFGRYATAMGVISAVVSAAHLSAGPGGLSGSNAALALTPLLYGVSAAYLFFLPVFHKLKGCVLRQARFREMLIEGMVAIAEGENPRHIETRLYGYLL